MRQIALLVTLFLLATGAQAEEAVDITPLMRDVCSHAMATPAMLPAACTRAWPRRTATTWKSSCATFGMAHGSAIS